MQVGVEDQVLFHALLIVLLAQRNDLLQDLGVEALYPCTVFMLLRLKHPPTRRIPLSFECKSDQRAHHAGAGWLAIEFT